MHTQEERDILEENGWEDQYMIEETQRCKLCEKKITETRKRVMTRSMLQIFSGAERLLVANTDRVSWKNLYK